jgi:multisubunit Na+/H+ antiporter MnhG subunit
MLLNTRPKTNTSRSLPLKKVTKTRTMGIRENLVGTGSYALELQRGSSLVQLALVAIFAEAMSSVATVRLTSLIGT